MAKRSMLLLGSEGALQAIAVAKTMDTGLSEVRGQEEEKAR